MFAYDINTVDIFSTKAIVDWEQSNLPTNPSNSHPFTQPYVNKKMPLTQPAAISPVKLPPSAFTQVDSWNVSADAWTTTPNPVPSMVLDHSPSKRESLIDPTMDAPTKQNLYKTELCRNWMETRQCRYGPKCQFAHGEDELRGLLRHPKYKSEICRSFHTSGKCSYGNRCRFVHSANEMRTPEGALLDDNGYSFQQQLAQLKFVDIMPSPNQSLFSSSTSFIPNEWLAEIDKLQQGERLSPHDLEPAHLQKPVGSPIPPMHATGSDSNSFKSSASPRQQPLHANAVPKNHLILPVPPQPQLSPSSGQGLTIDEFPSSAAKSYAFFEDDSDSADESSNEAKNLKKSGSTRRLGFFQKLYSSKTEKRSKS
jgi:hypothetical protein